MGDAPGSRAEATTYPMSSPRRRGPTTPNKAIGAGLAKRIGHGVWVPAFAGTTTESAGPTMENAETRENARARTHDSPRAAAVETALPHAILAHHLHQHALAQPAIGDAQPPAREGASHGIEDGAAGEHEIGALGTDAGVGDAILIAPVEQPLDHRGHLDIGQPAAVDPAAVITLEIKEHARDGGHRAGGAEHVHAVDRGTAVLG